MEYKINLGGRVITLVHENFEESIDVDSLTKIDHSNLYGEAVTMPAAMNRVGLLKADLQGHMDKAKLNLKIFEADYVAKKRAEASNNGGKFKIRVNNNDVEVKLTEKALEKCFENDPKWIELKEQYISIERDFNRLDSLYWSCQSKDKKLSNMTNSVTPEDMAEMVYNGKFNGITIKK